MINMKNITQAVESLLKAELPDYKIERNEERNTDPNVAASGGGWIGIYRGTVDYTPHAMGSRSWLSEITIDIEVQRASFTSGSDAEDKLEDSVKEVMDILTANKKLSDTVNMTTGYKIEYEFNAAETIYHHAAIITITAEVRA